VANGATGDALLLSPPLNVTGEETDAAFDLLDAALSDFEAAFLPG
jgi:4-aminobutyrate aminotransferase-like enzyme